MEKENQEKNTKILLHGKTYLAFDRFQMWIAKEVIKNGVPSLKRESGYYTTYESLLQGYVKEQGKKLKSDNVKDALEEFAKIERKLKQLGKEIGKHLDERKSK